MKSFYPRKVAMRNYILPIFCSTEATVVFRVLKEREKNIPLLPI